MIADKLEHWRRYEALAHLKPALEFLEGQTEVCLGSGRIEIDGDRLFALVQAYTPGPVAESRFETHRRYADIQFVAKGREMIGCAPAADLEVDTPYDPEKDVEFYVLPPAFSSLALAEGCFAVFYPEDGHLPGRRLDSDDQVCKIVVKVLLP
ncbi:MAG TPA: YhcH/YjgK/YiaL family protein [Armatimonadota bacterium]|nr:YhcH/YjgK/YiaL family protein [Armatimonadota bacterium]